MDIVEFLTAQLDEDQAMAEACPPGPWQLNDDHGSDYGASAADDISVKAADPEIGRPDTIFFGPSAKAYGELEVAPYRFVVRFDPARVLAEVAFKRRLIELHTTGSYRTYECSNGDHIQEWQCERAGEPFTEHRYCEVCGNECVELPLLTGIYTDRPGYKPAWGMGQ